MDYPITNKKDKTLNIFKEFHYLDIIPYSMALSLFSASIYIIIMAIELTKHSQ